MAAENGALRGGKVGGVADVVRDLPAALDNHGWTATVITPAYGVLHKLDGATQLASVRVAFAGATERADIWQVPGSFPRVRNLVIDHPLFAQGGSGRIYFSDEPNRPFATDASKFAFLCATVATWLNEGEEEELPDVVHLHDWHAAFYCLLRAFSEHHEKLRHLRTVFTIHNLSYQGTRPLRGDESSLETWFPELRYEPDSVRDPLYSDCINPMATAIRLADTINTVSPTYAREICETSNPAKSFIGGEGLEELLRQAASEDRLVGVLNGCYYDQATVSMGWSQLLPAMRQQVASWANAQPANPIHELAGSRLRHLGDEKPRTVLTSIGRLVAQKATLLIAAGKSGRPALEEIAGLLGDDEVLLILGSGEPEYERAIHEIAERNANIVFLCGYSEALADPLYQHGHLFLMPSSFEPCGISQMLAMRAAVPCVVHGVGGLGDTVENGRTGFVFTGDDLESQADAFVATTGRALDLRREQPEAWEQICTAAATRRFDWEHSAATTIRDVYGNGDD